MLWFAFKLCSLYIWLQLKLPKTTPELRCDLLSNFALCTFDYNRRFAMVAPFTVVICFQTLLFVHLITTQWCPICSCHRLWFAFKLCSLYIWLQPDKDFPFQTVSCDLLSNFALCTFDYNQLKIILQAWKVVICFQTLLFVHLITTTGQIL